MSVQSHFSKTSLASSGNSDIPETDFSQQAPRGQLFLPQLQEQRHLSWLCVRESQICPASQPALSSCHLRPSLLFKLHCTLRKIRFLQTGILAMQEAGIQGEMVVANYWMEVFNCERFSGPSLTHRFNIWKDADTSLDFNAWLKSAACRQNPKIQELEQSEAQRGGALRIDYLTAKETARYEIHFLNDAHGVYLVRAGQRFLTEHEQTLFRERTGRALFVLTLDQKLYAASQIFGKFHHSSFLRAKPIAAAGELITDKAGRLKGFTFNSGHYRPGKDQLMTFLTFLASRGIDLDQVEVDLSRGTSLKHHLSAALCHRQLLEGLDPFSLPAFIPLPSVLIEAPSDDLAEVTHNPESFPSPPSITAVTLSPNQPFPRFVFELRNALEGAFFTATQEIFPIPVVGSAIESALNADRILGVFISSIASASPATAEILSSPGEVFTSSFSLEADCFEYYKPF